MWKKSLLRPRGRGPLVRSVGAAAGLGVLLLLGCLAAPAAELEDLVDGADIVVVAEITKVHGSGLASCRTKSVLKGELAAGHLSVLLEGIASEDMPAKRETKILLVKRPESGAVYVLTGGPRGIMPAMLANIEAAAVAAERARPEKSAGSAQLPAPIEARPPATGAPVAETITPSGKQRLEAAEAERKRAEKAAAAKMAAATIATLKAEAAKRLSEGRALLAEEKFAAAAAKANDALEIVPGSPEAQALLAQIATAKRAKAEADAKAKEDALAKRAYDDAVTAVARSEDHERNIKILQPAVAALKGTPYEGKLKAAIATEKRALAEAAAAAAAARAEVPEKPPVAFPTEKILEFPVPERPPAAGPPPDEVAEVVTPRPSPAAPPDEKTVTPPVEKPPAAEPDEKETVTAEFASRVAAAESVLLGEILAVEGETLLGGPPALVFLVSESFKGAFGAGERIRVAIPPAKPGEQTSEQRTGEAVLFATARRPGAPPALVHRQYGVENVDVPSRRTEILRQLAAIEGLKVPASLTVPSAPPPPKTARTPATEPPAKTTSVKPSDEAAKKPKSVLGGLLIFGVVFAVVLGVGYAVLRIRGQEEEEEEEEEADAYEAELAEAPAPVAPARAPAVAATATAAPPSPPAARTRGRARATHPAEETVAVSKPASDSVDYDVVKEEDASYGSVVCFVLRARIARPATDEELRTVSKEIIGAFKDAKPHNAINLFFYLPDSDLDWLATGGTAVWAPYGDWDRASEVTAGDYSKHELVVKAGQGQGAADGETGGWLDNAT